MIPYYLREIPGNQFNSSQETPVFWHHANPEIGLFAFMYGLGGIIDGKDALNILSSICRNIEQRTDLNEGKEDLLKKLVEDAEEWLLIGGGRRDRSPGLKAMIDLAWLEEERGYFVKVGAGKIYSLHNDGRVFAVEDDNPACLGLREDISIKTQNLSDYKGLLFAPPDLFRRVTEKEVKKIFGKNNGRQPLEKLLELEKKIFEPELALLDRYSPEELIEMLRLYGRDSFIPEEKEMLAGVVATVSSQTPELRERILSDLGVGHISLLYIDLGDTEGKEKMRLQAESTERIKLILNLEEAKSSAVIAQTTAEAGEKAAEQEAEAARRRADRLECLQQKIYSALRLEEVENPEEVVLNAIDYAKKREAGLEEQLREAEERMREIKSILGQEKGELKDISDKYLLLEGKHQRLAGDYSSLQKHNDSIREHYEAMLAASRKEKEQADEKLGEERQRYARLVDVLRKETAEKEAYQLTAGQLTEKISTLTSAYDGLVDEAAGRGKKIAELLADYAQLGEENEKLKGQVEEASGQIIRLHADGEGYIERARTAEERLRKLTEDAIRQGTVLNGLKELVEASEKGRLEYQRLHEDSMEEIIGLRLKIEEYQSKEQDWERRLSEAMQSVRTEIVTEETTGKGREVQREESQIIMFSEESLQRIRAIADKYRVGK